MFSFRILSTFAALAVAGAGAVAETVEIPSARDNTLYQNAGGFFSNGAGAHFFAGRTDDGALRRGLIMFDVAGAIPAGATITSGVLRLRMTRTEAGGELGTLHRVTADWGESTSNAGTEDDGIGAIATAGDATWIHTFFNTLFWGGAGGDFVPAPSASQTVGGEASYTWGSSSGLVADLQSWLDNPSGNHGWVVRGNEGSSQTAKRFASREHPNQGFRPVLTVEFTPGAPPPGDADGDGDVDLADFAAYLDCVSGPGGGVSGQCQPVDTDMDGDVDLHDLGPFQRGFTGAQ